jgi:hypothetical protein
MSYYAEYDTVKTKMRVPDDSLKDELMIYIQEVEELINNRLRAKLGSRDVKGREITLPLTTSTVPAIDEELKAIAHDLVEGKFRLKTSEKDMLWNTATEGLNDYIEKRFGWALDSPFRVTPTITVSPLSGSTGTTVTVGGSNFIPTSTIRLTFGGLEPTTSPTAIVTDSSGSFTSATFTVPTSFSTGVYQVKCDDNDIQDRNQRDPNVEYSGDLQRFRVT